MRESLLKLGFGLLVAVLLCLSFMGVQRLADGPPSLGHTFPATVTEVYDGDTLTVQVTVDVRLRLLDCWAPEIRTMDADEKARGIKAREFLKSRIEGKRVIVSVPTNGAERLDDVITLGRVLARVYSEEGDVSAMMVREGHATKTKLE